MKNAFTLIELMVVIAITAILIALLLPVVTAAKKSSSLAISARSLSQLMVAGRLYLNDHNNTFWQYEQPVPGGAQWWFGFETTASLGMPEGQRTCDYSKGPLGPYTMTAGDIKTDPSLLQYSPRLKPKYQNGNYGYGYNTVLAVGPTGSPRNALQVALPGEMVVFATSAQVNTFQAPASAANPMIEEFYMVSNSISEKTVHFRNGGNAMAAFLDGSVRPLSMTNDMMPGSQDMRIPSANIGCLNANYLTQPGW